MRTLVIILMLAGTVFALDVGVDTILAPTGTIDSGQTISPRCIVVNYGDTAENVRVHMTVRDAGGLVYHDSLSLTSMAPAQRETVAFGFWVPQGRDSMTVTAWTVCTGDTFPANDTCRVRLFLRIWDVAVTQIIMPPPDTMFDSGVVFYPQCRVWNYGNQFISGLVRFRIGSSYQSTCIMYLFPGSGALVTASEAYTTMPGAWVCQVSAIVIGDMHPDNNIMADTFYVWGNRVVDVAAQRILVPPSYVDTSTYFVPCGTVKNNGSAPATFWAFFAINDSQGAPVYQDSTQAMLGNGDSTDVSFRTEIVRVIGEYSMACSVHMVGDQNSTNDCVRLPLHVVAGSGVEESPKLQASSHKLLPTIVSNVLNLGVDSRQYSAYREDLLDATGRRVAELHSGANDVSRLAPGVYFIRDEGRGAGDEGRVRKVVLQR